MPLVLERQIHAGLVPPAHALHEHNKGFTCGSHGRHKVGDAALCLLPHLRPCASVVAQRVVCVPKLVQDCTHAPRLQHPQLPQVLPLVATHSCHCLQPGTGKDLISCRRALSDSRYKPDSSQARHGGEAPALLLPLQRPGLGGQSRM